MAWNDLSIRDRHQIIKVGVQNGMRSMSDIRDAYNKFDRGGNIFDGNGSSEVEGVNPILIRANEGKVATNYTDAVDKSWSTKYRSAVRNFSDSLGLGLPSGVSNCTLTATQWIDPNNPIMSANTIKSNPLQHGYIPISEEEAGLGDLVIATNPVNGANHSMVINSRTKGVTPTYTYNGHTYNNIPAGEPLVNYSTGASLDSAFRQNIPLSVYQDQSEGKTDTHYYTYLNPGEFYTQLPTVVVTPNETKIVGKKKTYKRRAFGGNLFKGGGFEDTPDEPVTQPTSTPLEASLTPEEEAFYNTLDTRVAAYNEAMRKQQLADEYAQKTAHLRNPDYSYRNSTPRNIKQSRGLQLVNIAASSINQGSSDLAEAIQANVHANMLEKEIEHQERVARLQNFGNVENTILAAAGLGTNGLSEKALSTLQMIDAETALLSHYGDNTNEDGSPKMVDAETALGIADLTGSLDLELYPEVVDKALDATGKVLDAQQMASGLADPSSLWRDTMNGIYGLYSDYYSQETRNKLEELKEKYAKKRKNKTNK